jgi:hypothetical protein
MTGGPRPLYARVLRLRHLHLRPLVAFMLFEGSVAFSIVLVLADLIPVWGVGVIPVAVAVMVKLNDLVAGALNRPLALAQLRTPRPRDRAAVGRSAVPYGPTSLDGDRDGLVPIRLDDPVHHERGRESRTWAIARVVARGRASVRSSRSSEPAQSSGSSPSSMSPGSSGPSGLSGPDVVRPDGADRHNRGNTGRFGG